MSKESWFINESELDDYQVPIVQKKMNSSFVVKGCAGSGKTVLALWKTREIHEEDSGSFYFVVFTKALRQFIEDGVRAAGLPSDRVVHHWYWENKLNAPSADYIIIDEVQDFTLNELNQLKNAARKAFILFGDSAQQLYKGMKSGLMNMEDIAYHTRLPMEQLVLNHRLPKNIAYIAEYVNTTGDSIASRCTKEGAGKPFLVKASTWQSQLNFIKETVEERDYTDVGILFPNNQKVKDAEEYFSDHNFRVEAKYDLPQNRKFTLNFHSENPKLMTYHSAKGLQFEAVFIVEPTVNGYDREAANPLYVALTRTYQDLFILHANSLPGPLAQVPQHYFEKISHNGNSTTSGGGYSAPIEEEHDDLPF